MWKIRISLAIFLILVLVSVSGAQTAPKAPPPTERPRYHYFSGQNYPGPDEKKCPGWHRDPGAEPAGLPLEQCQGHHSL